MLTRRLLPPLVLLPSIMVLLFRFWYHWLWSLLWCPSESVCSLFPSSSHYDKVTPRSITYIVVQVCFLVITSISANDCLYSSSITTYKPLTVDMKSMVDLTTRPSTTELLTTLRIVPIPPLPLPPLPHLFVYTCSLVSYLWRFICLSCHFNIFAICSSFFLYHDCDSWDREIRTCDMSWAIYLTRIGLTSILYPMIDRYSDISQVR
jgi:hypothetical protein